MAREVQRLWFVPGNGIDRHVISTDIQRYLGNDATVRPGRGSEEDEGVDGYWIKAYRNLTSAMISDLQDSSTRWRREQRATGARDNKYEDSQTFRSLNTSRAGATTTRSTRHGGDSPSVDGPFEAPSSRDPTRARERDRERERERDPRDQRDRERERERVTINRRPAEDSMDIDPPMVAPPDRRYAPDPRAYQQESRTAYPPDRTPFEQDGRPQHRGQQPSPAYAQVPVSTYGQDPRYAPSYPPGSDGAPPGMVRQGNYYVPISSLDPPAMPPGRSELPPQYPSGAYGQPSMPPGREQREPREARYGAPPGPEYQDPSRYAYPSPAATVSSVARERDSLGSQVQPRFAQRRSPSRTNDADKNSAYGAPPPPQFDQYGRPAVPSGFPPGQQERGVQPPLRESSNYPRERAPAQPAPGGESREPRRRRVQ